MIGFDSTIRLRCSGGVCRSIGIIASPPRLLKDAHITILANLNTKLIHYVQCGNAYTMSHYVIIYPVC